MKYEFMRQHADQFSLAGMCRALSASRSGYYAWCDREPSAHHRDDLALAAHVRRIHAASREAYGARKVWKALVAEGITCGRHRGNGVRDEWHLLKPVRPERRPKSKDTPAMG